METDYFPALNTVVSAFDALHDEANAIIRDSETRKSAFSKTELARSADAKTGLAKRVQRLIVGLSGTERWLFESTGSGSVCHFTLVEFIVNNEGLDVTTFVEMFELGVGTGRVCCGGGACPPVVIRRTR